MGQGQQSRAASGESSSSVEKSVGVSSCIDKRSISAHDRQTLKAATQARYVIAHTTGNRTSDLRCPFNRPRRQFSPQQLHLGTQRLDRLQNVLLFRLLKTR